MSFADAVRNVLSNYANFNGRARRSEYWWWALAAFVTLFVVALIDQIIGTYPLLYVIAALAILVPNFAVGARRLHDTGKSGWLQLIAIIPLVGFIILIVFYATDSEPDNKYGPSPKNVAGGYPGQPGMPNPYAG